MPILQFPTDAERYPGERQDLIGGLKAARQQLTELFGVDTEIFRQIDSALRGGDLPALRAAQAEVKSFLRNAVDQVLDSDGTNPEGLAEIARKMDEIRASKSRNFLDWLADDDTDED